jgi:hypothetical protein
VGKKGREGGGEKQGGCERKTREREVQREGEVE